MIGKGLMVALATVVLSNGAASAQTLQLGSESKQMLYVALRVADYAKSRDFYTNIVGLKEIPTPAGYGAPPNSPAARSSGSFSFTGTYGQTFFRLQQAAVHGGEESTLARIVFKVEDARGIVARAKAAGFAIVRDALPSGEGPNGGRGSALAVIKDPDGNLVEIVQPTGA